MFTGYIKVSTMIYIKNEVTQQLLTMFHHIEREDISHISKIYSVKVCVVMAFIFRNNLR